MSTEEEQQPLSNGMQRRGSRSSSGGSSAATTAAASTEAVVAAQLPAALLPGRASRSSQTGDPADKKAAGYHPLSFLGDNPDALGQGFHNPAMDKMFQDLEKTILESTKSIDEMNQRMEQERKQQERQRDTAHVPAALKSDGRSLDSLLEEVSGRLFHVGGGASSCQLAAQAGRRQKLRQLDQRAYTVLCCHSLAAWLASSGGPRHCQESFAAKMHADLTDWIPKVWRLGAGELVFHMDKWDGLVLACRRALLLRFPSLLDCGFECLFSKPPVVYLHPSAPPHLLAYLSCQLCLPRTCFRLVPATSHNADCMDHAELARLVQEDTGEGRTPLFVYAVCGSPATGSYDRLGRIATVCRQHRLWLHVQGSKLAQLALNSVPTSLRPLLGGNSAVSSCLLEFDQWLGHPGLINATVLRTTRDGTQLHQTTDAAAAAASQKGKSTQQQQKPKVQATAPQERQQLLQQQQQPAEEAPKSRDDKDDQAADPNWSAAPPPPPADLRCMSYQPMWLLPLWVALQAMGYDNIQARARSTEQTVKTVMEALKTVADVEICEPPSLSEEDRADIKANSNLLGQLLSFLIDFELAPTVLLFRYWPPELRRSAAGSATTAAATTAASAAKNAKATAGAATAPYAVKAAAAAAAAAAAPPMDCDSQSVAAATDDGDDNDDDDDEAWQQLQEQLYGENRWLAESLRSSVPHLQLSVVKLPAPIGPCIRFSPMESCADFHPDQMAGLPEALAESVRLLDSTRRARPEFARLVGACGGRLQLVQLPGWPGLGGLRYVCEDAAATEETAAAVNRNLAAAVVADDTGFGWADGGCGDDGGGCLRCGLVPEDADLPALVGRVLAAGRAAEAALGQAARTDELVRQRIREAEAALQLEQQKRLAEAGALRQVPYLDSFVNWFSPLAPTAASPPPGAAFSLQSGRLSSTELTYKYKMQINGE